MKSKSKMWLLLWFLSMLIGTAINFVYQLQYSLRTGVAPPKNAILADPTTPLAQLQSILLLIYLPLITLPLLGCTYHHAKLEQEKVIRIFSIVMMGFTLFAMVVTAVQLI